MPKMIKEVLAIPGLTGLFVATLFAGIAEAEAEPEAAQKSTASASLITRRLNINRIRRNRD